MDYDSQEEELLPLDGDLYTPSTVRTLAIPKCNVNTQNVNQENQEKESKDGPLTARGLGFPKHFFGSALVKTKAPAKLSTLQIMRNPLIFHAGVGLLKKLSEKEMTAGEVLNRMGIKGPHNPQNELQLGLEYQEPSNDQPSSNVSKKRKKDVGKKKKRTRKASPQSTVEAEVDVSPMLTEEAHDTQSEPPLGNEESSNNVPNEPKKKKKKGSSKSSSRSTLEEEVYANHMDIEEPTEIEAGLGNEEPSNEVPRKKKPKKGTDTNKKKKPKKGTDTDKKKKSTPKSSSEGNLEEKIDVKDEAKDPCVDENENCNPNGEAEDVENLPNEQEQGEVLIRELLDRVQAGDSEHECVDVDSTENLYAPAKCFQNAFPGYEKKHRAYKKHARRIKKLTMERLETHYKAIRPILRSIFEGKVENERTNFYLQGHYGLKILQDMSVSVPFEHNQTIIIINKMLEYFVPDVLDRPNWSNYISYVLLPEALINIYARVNKIPVSRAENEMRFRGCYEDEEETMAE